MFENVDVTIEFSEVPRPAPLLGATKMLDDLRPGQTMCIISACPDARDDLSAWCLHTGNTLVSTTRQSNGKTAYLLCKAGAERTTPIPHMTLDMRGVSCPGPILGAKNMLEGMRSDEVLQLVTDCSAAIAEVHLWSRTTSVEVLLTLEMGDGVQKFYLKKR